MKQLHVDKRLTDFRSMSAFVVHTYNDIFLTGLKKKAHNICFPSNVCSREMEAEIWLRENMKNRNSFILTWFVKTSISSWNPDSDTEITLIINALTWLSDFMATETSRFHWPRTEKNNWYIYIYIYIYSGIKSHVSCIAVQL